MRRHDGVHKDGFNALGFSAPAGVLGGLSSEFMLSKRSNDEEAAFDEAAREERSEEEEEEERSEEEDDEEEEGCEGEQADRPRLKGTGSCVSAGGSSVTVLLRKKST